MPKQDWKPWSVSDILIAWGCHRSGKLTNPTPNPTHGGNPEDDAEAQAAKYLEHTEGFVYALPVLTHVYAFMRPIESFRLCEPGETAIKAILRNQWGFLLGKNPKDSAVIVHRMFVRELRCRTICEPFVPVMQIEEVSAAELNARRLAYERAMNMVPQERDTLRGRPKKQPRPEPTIDTRTWGYETKGMRKGRN